MCGICGFVGKKGITIDVLTKMNNSMIHRGPDDSGVELYEAPNGYIVGLAQRRLSIMDLSSLGHQPMHSTDGQVTVVFNGEIYNFKEIKKKLSDYCFRSLCDTEVIIASYLKWGINCVNHFDGMFAIAIYDRNEETFFLVRDRLGQKPLYYWNDIDNSRIVFASELKPIILCPEFKCQINKKILQRYLVRGYINAPESVFESVYKIEPGSLLCFKNGNIHIKKYWDVNTRYHKMILSPVNNYFEAKEELERLLTASVSKRMISDVPVGTFLSGGYDSSLITALVQKTVSADTPVCTFTIGFNDKQFNEAQYAKEVADYLGTNHKELYISEDEMRDLVFSLPEYFDEPFADSSQIPTMLVSKMAKDFVTVILSGDAGDELFCGYKQYDYARKAQYLDGIGKVANFIGKANLFGNTLSDRYPVTLRAISDNRSVDTKTQFTVTHYAAIAEKMVLCDDGIPVLYPIEKKYNVKNWQIKNMLLDLETYLPGDILAKVDRSSMKYSLEARCPFLDKDVVEYSFRIAHKFKYNRGIKKAILKDIAYEYIPRELLDRPKQGFSVPIEKWLHGPLKDELLSYVEPLYLERQGLFQKQYVNDFVNYFLSEGDARQGKGKKYSTLVWSFFVFQKWYNYYIVNR